MSTSKKPTANVELENIDDAIVDSILNASEEDLREELLEAGLDPDSLIKDVEATIVSAKSEVNRKHLNNARQEYEEWAKREIGGDVASLDAAREKLSKLRSGDSSLDQKMMIAARKGEGLSDSDLEGLLGDIAALEEMDNGDDS